MLSSEFQTPPDELQPVKERQETSSLHGLYFPRIKFKQAEQLNPDASRQMLEAAKHNQPKHPRTRQLCVHSKVLRLHGGPESWTARRRFLVLRLSLAYASAVTDKPPAAGVRF